MSECAELAERFFEAYNRQDFDLVESMIEPELDFGHFNRGFTVTKRSELVDGLRYFAANVAPDRRFTFERSTAAGNVVVREAWWEGTSRTPLPGIVDPAGPFRLRLCSVLRFNDAGRIVEWKDHG